VAIAGELIRSGAEWEYVTEQFAGRLVLLDFEASCVEPVPSAAAVLEGLRLANGAFSAGCRMWWRRYSAGWSLTEAKVARKDSLQPNQHALADIARREFGGDRVDIAVVEWL
jgi:hypothetical protein